MASEDKTSWCEYLVGSLRAFKLLIWDSGDSRSEILNAGVQIGK